MKLPVLLITAALFARITASAQNPSTGYDAKKSDQHQKILEKGKNYDVNFDIENHEAFFLEGEDSLFRYLYTKISIPKEAADARLVTTSTIGFQVNFDGKVLDARIIDKAGYGIDEQLVKHLSGLEFVPATQGNMPYRSEMILEIPVKAAYLYNIQERVGMKE